jgi:hypothetical protein
MYAPLLVRGAASRDAVQALIEGSQGVYVVADDLRVVNGHLEIPSILEPDSDRDQTDRRNRHHPDHPCEAHVVNQAIQGTASRTIQLHNGLRRPATISPDERITR